MSTATIPDRASIIPEADFEEVASRPGTPTWEIAYLYPQQGEWTEEEYLDVVLGQNWMIEFTDGCLEFLPMPMPSHYFIVEHLFDRLRKYLKRMRIPGRPMQAPIPVRLRGGKYCEPDIFFPRPEQVPDPHRPALGADLVMEVVSPGKRNRERDFEEKRMAYAQAGISEYWIIDPQERRITMLVLDGDTYRVHGEFGPGTKAKSVHFPGFAVSVKQVFAAGEAGLPKKTPDGQPPRVD